MQDIDNSCPNDLEPYAKAYEIERNRADEQVWLWCGQYVLPSVAVAVEHCLAGRKAKSKYVEKPVSVQIAENKDEEVLQKKREAFVAGLLAMQANYEINHPKNESEVVK